MITGHFRKQSINALVLIVKKNLESLLEKNPADFLIPYLKFIHCLKIN